MRSKFLYSFALLSIILLASCSKEEILEIPEVVDTPIEEVPGWTTLSERFSPINETTGYFKNQEFFDDYFNKEFLEELSYYQNPINYRVFGQSVVVFDFNNDGKQDLFAFATSFCNEHPYSFHPGKFILVSDFKGEKIKIVTDSTFYYGVTLSVGDFNNDGYSDILASSHDTKQNSYIASEDQGGFSNYPFSKPRIITFSSGTLTQYEVGVKQDTHAITSGDINNDGLIDFIQFPISGMYNGSWDNNNYVRPTVSINNGGFSFTTFEIASDIQYREWYALSYELFDLNKDGALDIIVGFDIGVRKKAPFDFSFSDNTDGPVVLWGDNSGQFSIANASFLVEQSLTSTNRTSSILGFGFTDFDSDGDIDVVVTTTRNEPEGDFNNGLYYRSYFLISFENLGDKNFTEIVNISGNVDESQSQFTNFYYVRSIDYDKDGDIDLVPSGIPNWGINFIDNLHWKKEGNSYVRSW